MIWQMAHTLAWSYIDQLRSENQLAVKSEVGQITSKLDFDGRREEFPVCRFVTGSVDCDIFRIKTS